MPLLGQGNSKAAITGVNSLNTVRTGLFIQRNDIINLYRECLLIFSSIFLST